MWDFLLMMSESPWIYGLIWLVIGYNVCPSETENTKNHYGFGLFFGRMRVVLTIICWGLALAVFLIGHCS
jgi:hypothetical protein